MEKYNLNFQLLDATGVEFKEIQDKASNVLSRIIMNTGGKDNILKLYGLAISIRENNALICDNIDKNLVLETLSNSQTPLFVKGQILLALEKGEEVK